MASTQAEVTVSIIRMEWVLSKEKADCDIAVIKMSLKPYEHYSILADHEKWVKLGLGCHHQTVLYKCLDTHIMMTALLN